MPGGKLRAGKATTLALEALRAESLEVRESLPPSYAAYMGVSNEDSADPRRDVFAARLADIVEAALARLNMDMAVDQHVCCGVWIAICLCRTCFGMG